MRDVYFLSCAVLLCGVSGRVLNSTGSPQLQQQSSSGPTPVMKPDSSPGVHRVRRKRFISQSDMVAILDYHNQVRASVFPPAANMEYMVWDNDLARTAEAWAATCVWAHGPAYLLQFYGQNLSVRTGGYQSILQLVKPWYDEVNDYVFPYPRFCNPSCPLLCYGPMCTHYTQMVWASTSRVGCAVQTCYNMFVWGALWTEATFLVCNYSPKLVDPGCVSLCGQSRTQQEKNTSIYYTLKLLRRQVESCRSSEETGSERLRTELGFPVQPVHPAMEEPAATTCAFLVCSPTTCTGSSKEEEDAAHGWDMMYYTRHF